MPDGGAYSNAQTLGGEFERLQPALAGARHTSVRSHLHLPTVLVVSVLFCARGFTCVTIAYPGRDFSSIQVAKNECVVNMKEGAYEGRIA